MGTHNQHDGYRLAFEQAKSLFQRLTLELDALDQRHAALVVATKALEAMMAQRAGQQTPSDQNLTAGAAIAYTGLSAPQSANRIPMEMTQTYLHRDLPNAIQRRIDLALGQK